MSDETPVMVECPECGEIYNADDNDACPYCGAER